MSAPTCPEHGEEMIHEAQPNWWRGKCCCQIRVFEEDRKAYVPASAVRHRKIRSTVGEVVVLSRGGTIWLPL